MSDTPVSDERLAELIWLVVPESQAIGKSLATDIRTALRESQAARRELASRVEELARARNIAAEQAEDDGLWFAAQTAPEAYLQRALRRMHAAVENDQAVLAALSSTGEQQS